MRRQTKRLRSLTAEVQGSARADSLTPNKPCSTGLLRRTALSLCIGTHGQKNIRLTGASIVFPGACQRTSTLIIHGHVHDGPARQLCQQANRHGYGPGIVVFKNPSFYSVLNFSYASSQIHCNFFLISIIRRESVSQELLPYQVTVICLLDLTLRCKSNLFLGSKHTHCCFPIEK